METTLETTFADPQQATTPNEWQLYALGTSILLAWHMHEGQRVALTYNASRREYRCLTCGATRPDRIESHERVVPWND